MRATVARRSLRAATADYDEMAEPNMKLSRALLIVLLLHVVAVSGIIAFNAIKTRQEPSIPRIKGPAAPQSDKTNNGAGSLTADETEATKPGEIRRARPVGKENAKDHAKASDAAHHDDTHKIYTVAKGDTPVTIAKKFKVSHDEVLALNHIDDPRKLKIGQKLLIPNKSVKGKKSDE
ncbi:MAG TPA: LysM domain-containing protein [Chthoniobacterales bacterium]|jgi:LysM repeat protein